MKHLSIFAIVFTLCLGLNAQNISESNVPDVVKNNFSRVVPNTQVSTWKMESGNYEAIYMDKEAKNSIQFTTDGKIIQYKYTISANELPEACRNYVSSNFTGQKVGIMTRIKQITGNVSYEVEIGDKTHSFDINGEYLGNENPGKTPQK